MPHNLMNIMPDFEGWAVDFLSQRIRSHLRAFEWGGGWSTVWLGARCLSVVSVEHDAEWHQEVKGRLSKHGLTNVKLLHIPQEQGDHDYADYVAKILWYPDEHFDIVCVDGRNRAECIKNAMTKLTQPGGMLVVDDYPRAQYQEALQLMDGWHRVLFYRGKETMATGVWFRPEGE